MIIPTTVEIPDHIAAEYDVVGVRFPTRGETYLGDCNKAVQCVSITFEHVRPILVPKFVWPDWLLANFIAQDADGSWWGYTEEPQLCTDCWSCDAGLSFSLTNQSAAWMKFIDVKFTPPHCTDWRSSKRRNPNTRK